MLSEPLGTEDFKIGLDIDLLAPPTVFGGDYYWESEDVTRGLSLIANHITGFSHGSDSKGHIALAGRFQSVDMAMTISPEAASYLPPTTLRINGSSPSEIGNTLLDLLETMGGIVTKVNRQNFTIKATITLDGLDFEVKMRVYQQEQMHIVEFQRYSGDGVMFYRFYCQAGAYLRSYTGREFT